MSEHAVKATRALRSTIVVTGGGDSCREVRLQRRLQGVWVWYGSGMANVSY